MAASIRSSNSITSAESPALTMRKSLFTAGERLQQLLVNPSEAAVRHQDDEIARLTFGDDRVHDRLNRLRRACRLAVRLQIADEHRHRQPFRLGQRRSKHRGEDDLARSGKSTRKIGLEYPP